MADTSFVERTGFNVKGLTMVYVDWPTSDHEFWWMQFQLPAHRTKRVRLVTLVTRNGVEYLKPWDDNKWCSRSLAREWQARFKPCESHPIFD